MSIAQETAAEIGLRWIFQSYWGFKNAPQVADFNAYGKALLICAKGDGDLADEEREYAVGLIAGMHGPADLVEELKTDSGDGDLKEVLGAAEGAGASGACLLYDAIRVSAADGVLAPGELEQIEAAADLLGVGRDAVAQLVEIHQQEAELVKRRFELCYPDAESRPF
ncbi:hypothetical protein [Streptomyces clavuligerus]|uniref:hypothetical protein n=1 Tax=Streptomyces clavuligerus TaxID=1901 RepID=UPI00017FEFCC|nr:hypothetical protein [Streptomyces clavuligerus]ANW22223.1 tellurium resistance protein [Streptomyces clavuligerus]AXU17117.1 tellurium resistance protein [Streptomyces clavuligerus]EDY47721.1 tellurite resistance protein [Streptomyces clavuligerus]MBY6307238.1 tellurium resistance protein [Streptomyces clavuligerus]QCS10187.1 tellurium resistance protein [Streptomyces clavuligerus]